jgi:hypothetical protein
MKVQLRNIGVALVLGLVTAALLAGPAQATRPDDRAGMRGVGAISADTSQPSVRPDDRGSLRGPGALAHGARAQAPVRPDDRAGWRGPGATDVVPAASKVTVDDRGFPWTDAALGVGLLALLGLFGAALVLNGRYERRPI